MAFAQVEGRTLRMGPALLRELELTLPSGIAEAGEQSERRGQTTVYLPDEDRVIAVFALADKIREESRAAVEAGDVVLVRSDPRDLPRIIALSRATYRKMLQNLWWAAGYNIFAIPLAAGALAGWGILLPPAFAAVLMSASTIIVAANAQLLRRTDLSLS